jgi:DNA-binding MarR family transcriptional regulator
LNRASQHAQKLLEHYLEPLALRTRQYEVLVVLSEEGALAQVELGRHLQIDRTTMVFLVDQLEESGLVERRRMPDDRRMHAITLTAQGKMVLAQANERVRLAEEEFLAPLSAAERDHLRTLLLRLT